MKLNVQERLTLVNSLPEKGDFTTMTMIESMKNLLYPTEVEIKKFEIMQDGERISWNPKGAKGVEIKLSEGQKGIITTAFGEMDKRKELTLAHFQLFKRFKEENE